MGGVAGIVFGSHASPDTAKLMAAMMPYRAVDGSSEASGAGISFVSLYRRPHYEYDTLPPKLDVGKSTYVVVDSRLDNREELLREFGLHEASDNQLIFRAWQKWGQAFPEKLLGDFAFAIYDGDKQTLILGRDPVGVKPLFYSWIDQSLTFASEVAPLLHLVHDRDISYLHIKNFLLGQATDSNEISFKGIFRVPAGTVLEIGPDRQISQTRYWDPYSITIRPNFSATDLWSILTEAVRSRSKNTGPVGYACSGGLDSTAICYAASLSQTDTREPIRTFSIVFDQTPAESERIYIEAALGGLSAQPTFIDLSRYDPLSELDGHLTEQARLVHAPGLVMNGQLYRHISAAGCTVFLDGHGGDEVISHGLQRLSELATQRQWKALWDGAAAAASTLGSSRLKVFLLYWLKHGMRRMYAVRKRIFEALKSDERNSDLVGVELQFIETETEFDSSTQGDAQNAAHIKTVFNVTVTESLEVIELAAVRRGIEVRFPFFDRRVLEYALSLPESAKLQGRYTRAILRTAMKDIVPEQVRLRTAKFDFTSHLARGILSSPDTTITTLLQSNVTSRLINSSYLKSAWASMSKLGPNAHNSYVLATWRAIALYKWMRTAAKDSKH